MKTYIAKYSRYGRGYQEEAHYLINANTKSEALGMALSEKQDSDKSEWSFDSVDTSIAGAHYIQEYERYR